MYIDLICTSQKHPQTSLIKRQNPEIPILPVQFLHLNPNNRIHQYRSIATLTLQLWRQRSECSGRSILLLWSPWITWHRRITNKENGRRLKSYIFSCWRQEKECLGRSTLTHLPAYTTWRRRTKSKDGGRRLKNYIYSWWRQEKEYLG